MKSRILAVFCAALFLTAFSVSSWAQTAPGTLKGQVSDPAGAVVTQVTVTATSSTGQTASAVTNRQGMYEIKGLAPGKYSVRATASGFSDFQEIDFSIASGQVQQFDIRLEIPMQKQQVNVEEQSSSVDVAPASNVSAIVLKGKDLDALSDDPDELQSDLQTLAGPSAGPNGGQIYIDGFTGGQLPPKSSIREIRINTNPFSSQFDRIGFGRIEVFTKPGTDKFHGQFSFNDNDSALNGKNPFGGANQLDYRSQQYSGNVGGPINKKASFFFNVERRNINDTSIVNAVVLDPSFNQVPLSESVLDPRVRTNITPRFDIQLGANNTLTTRYQYETDTENNNGVGGQQFKLPTQGLDLNNTEQSFQVSDSQIINPTTINETRFQYNRNRNSQTPQNLSSAISVLGAFVGGGNSSGTNVDHNDRYEVQNYTSMSRGKHFIKFGGRLRASHEVNSTTGGFNGTFTFTNCFAALPGNNPCPGGLPNTALSAYQITQQGLQNGLTTAQIRAAGGGASQFILTTGQPLANVNFADAGLYAEDDWKLRPNFTLSYGMRFETQTAINDHASLAPRIGIAWGLGSAKSQPKTVLRAGFGIFYDRFSQNLVLQAQRQNGITQQQFVVNFPDFYPNIPSQAALAAAQTFPTVYQISPNLKAPYMMQTALTLERQVSKTSNVSATFINSRGVHQLITDNINAPLPGSGLRPNGTATNIYEYESEGIFNQRQLIVNGNVRVGQKLTLFTYYSLNFANGDSSGAGSFPSNPFNLSADYGRTAFDIRNRFAVGGSWTLPYGVRLNPLVSVTSGVPFNIILGRDLNGDSIFNDRPTFATVAGPSVVQTQWGAFDTSPKAGQTVIPMNYGQGKPQFNFNLRVSRTIGFGPKVESAAGANRGAGGGGGDRGGERGGGGGGFGGARGPGGPGGTFAANNANRRYNLTVSANVRNLFNYVNYGTPIGNLNSPLFGQSNTLAGGGPGGSTAANRRIELQMQFSF
ncbi:MAG: Oar protein [Candidatus Angelobacter sp.]|nr:Oar protein [Candidatus Angelobacter sp.]